MKKKEIIFKITPSIDPIVSVCFYFHSYTHDKYENIKKCAELFGISDDLLTEDYSVSKFADCFLITECIDESEPLIELQSNDNSDYYVHYHDGVNVYCNHHDNFCGENIKVIILPSL